MDTGMLENGLDPARAAVQVMEEIRNAEPKADENDLRRHAAMRKEVVNLLLPLLPDQDEAMRWLGICQEWDTLALQVLGLHLERRIREEMRGLKDNVVATLAPPTGLVLVVERIGGGGLVDRDKVMALMPVLKPPYTIGVVTRRREMGKRDVDGRRQGAVGRRVQEGIGRSSGKRP